MSLLQMYSDLKTQIQDFNTAAEARLHAAGLDHGQQMYLLKQDTEEKVLQLQEEVQRKIEELQQLESLRQKENDDHERVQAALQHRVLAAESSAAAAATAAVSSKASSLKAAEATITELGTRLSIANASLARQALELAAKDTEVRSTAESLQAANAALRGKLEAVEGDVIRLSEVSQLVKEECDAQLKQVSKDSDQKLALVQREVEALRTAADQDQEALKRQMEAEKSTHELTEAQLSANIKELQRSLEAARLESKETVSEIEAVREDLKAAQKLIEQREASLLRLRSEADLRLDGVQAAEREQLRALEAKMDVVNQAKREADERIKVLEACLDSQKKTSHAQLQEMLGLKDEQLKSLQLEVLTNQTLAQNLQCQVREAEAARAAAQAGLDGAVREARQQAQEEAAGVAATASKREIFLLVQRCEKAEKSAEELRISLSALQNKQQQPQQALNFYNNNTNDESCAILTVAAKSSQLLLSRDDEVNPATSAVIAAATSAAGAASAAPPPALPASAKKQSSDRHPKSSDSSHMTLREDIAVGNLKNQQVQKPQVASRGRKRSIGAVVREQMVKRHVRPSAGGAQLLLPQQMLTPHCLDAVMPLPPVKLQKTVVAASSKEPAAGTELLRYSALSGSSNDERAYDEYDEEDNNDGGGVGGGHKSLVVNVDKMGVLDYLDEEAAGSDDEMALLQHHPDDAEADEKIPLDAAVITAAKDSGLQEAPLKQQRKYDHHPLCVTSNNENCAKPVVRRINSSAALLVEGSNCDLFAMDADNAQPGGLREDDTSEFVLPLSQSRGRGSGSVQQGIQGKNVVLQEDAVRLPPPCSSVSLSSARLQQHRRQTNVSVKDSAQAGAAPAASKTSGSKVASSVVAAAATRPLRGGIKQMAAATSSLSSPPSHEQLKQHQLPLAAELIGDKEDTAGVAVPIILHKMMMPPKVTKGAGQLSLAAASAHNHNSLPPAAANKASPAAAAISVKARSTAAATATSWVEKAETKQAGSKIARGCKQQQQQVSLVSSRKGGAKQVFQQYQQTNVRQHNGGDGGQAAAISVIPVPAIPAPPPSPSVSIGNWF